MGFSGPKELGNFPEKVTPDSDVQRGDHMVNGSELVGMPWWALVIG